MPKGIDTFIAAASKHKEKRRRYRKREAIQEELFTDWCEENEIWCIRLVFLFGKGWPDRTLLIPGGYICFVEMKKDKTGPLSPKQIEVRSKLKKLGFKYIVGYGAVDALKKTKRYYEAIKASHIR